MYDKPSPLRLFLLITVPAGIYAATFMPIYAVAGPSVGILGNLALFISGIMLGFPWVIAAAVIIIASNTWLYSQVMTGGLVDGVLSVLMQILVAWVSVLFHNLSKQARLQSLELRQANGDLQRALTMAVEAVESNQKLISLVAHDLRTPLVACQGNLEMLRSALPPTLEPQVWESMQVLQFRLKAIGDLVERVLDINRLSKGGLEARKILVEARILVGNAMALRALAEQKHIALVNEIPEGEQLSVDPVLMGEAVLNLVTNAIKFTRPGGQIRLFLPPGRPNTLAVEDTGVGIEPQRMSHLFELEQNKTTLGTGGEKGTGLGLVITRDILSAHGGQVYCESTPGRGSVFYLEVPGP